MSGLPAAIWLLGLFAAAPLLRTTARYGLSDRLRDALILGVALPFALGLFHLLYPAACWCALTLCVALSYARNLAGKPSRDSSAGPPYLLIGALVVVTWPQLMRPLLDGDSLSYHLPNAAAWVQSHSLWTTATRYWWYPPASELFAAALYAVGGPFALPWSGFIPLALLGFRVATWARSADATPPLLADALAAALVTAYPLAIQGATMQNDVWLAAFFLEGLWVLRRPSDKATAIRTLALTALVKPQGWILAVIAMGAGRATRAIWFATAAALALWIVRDAILWNGAHVALSSTMRANVFGSTILAHGLPAFWLLVRVTAIVSPFALLAFFAALTAPLLTRNRRLGWAACASAVLFFLLPFGYATAVAQLATGASLRFAAPAIAIGATLLARPARRAASIVTALLAASTLYGVWYVLAIFWNDGGTHVAIACGLLAVAITAVARWQRSLWTVPVAFGASVVLAIHLAARHPLDYYADSLRVGATQPGVYRWIAATHPAAVGGWGLRVGVVNVLSPSTRTVDLPDADPCTAARHDRVLLVAVAQNDLPDAANATLLHAARACGSALYADSIAIVARP